MKGERDLVWYLTIGIPKFERSPMGSMLAMIDLRASASRECPRCEGAGILNERWTMREDWHGNPIAPREIPTGFS